MRNLHAKKRRKGKQDFKPLRIKPQSKHVTMTVDCDLSAPNEFRIETQVNGDKVRHVGTLATPTPLILDENDNPTGGHVPLIVSPDFLCGRAGTKARITVATEAEIGLDMDDD